MAKSKKSTKKSLLVASLSLIVVFAVVLIVMAVVPYSITPYRYTSDSGKTTTTYRFRSDEYEITTETTILGSESTTTLPAISYTIEKNDDGKYVVKPYDAAALGTINAYKLVIGDTEYTNAFTQTLMIVSIVGICLGGVGLVLYFVMGNKKTAKKKK